MEFEYDKTLFDIDKETLSDKSKTPLKRGETIKITCLKDLDSDKDIKIYAYPKEIIPVTDKMGTKLGGKLYQFLSRKLAGRIIVLQNDSRVRKKEKIVFIPVKTNVTGFKEEIGNFNTENAEVENFYNSFYQSLIIPIVEFYNGVLDLSLNQDFQICTDDLGNLQIGKYVDQLTGKINEDWQEFNPNGSTKTNFFKVVQNIFFGEKDEKGNLKNEKYKNDYLTVFSLGGEVYDNAQGQVGSQYIIIDNKLKKEFLKNIILFKQRDQYTLNHESYHCFGIYHIHRESRELVIKDKNKKYIFTYGATTNVIAYNSNAYSSWRWQWEIINPNIKGK